MADQTPAGWYPEGGDPDRLRWFDGVVWTSHTVTREAPAGGPTGRPPSETVVIPPLPAPQPRPVLVQGGGSAAGRYDLEPTALPAPAAATFAVVPAAPSAPLVPMSVGIDTPDLQLGAGLARGATSTATLERPAYLPDQFLQTPAPGWPADVMLAVEEPVTDPAPARRRRVSAPTSRLAVGSLALTLGVPTALLVMDRMQGTDLLPAWLRVGLWLAPVGGVVLASVSLAHARGSAKNGAVAGVSLLIGLLMVAYGVVGVAMPALGAARQQAHDTEVKKDLLNAALALEKARTRTGHYPGSGTLPVAKADSQTMLRVCYLQAKNKVTGYLIVGAHPAGSGSLTFDSRTEGVLTATRALPAPFVPSALACPTGTKSGPTS